MWPLGQLVQPIMAVRAGWFSGTFFPSLAEPGNKKFERLCQRRISELYFSMNPWFSQNPKYR
jgi:hypothetical protein